MATASCNFEPNGIAASTALDAARAYRQRGYEPIPIPSGSKNPGYAGWQHTRLADTELSDRFQNGSNIGLLLGTPSGGLVDVDIDCAEALVIAAEILPRTGMISGRSGKLRSHYWYRLGDPGKTAQFLDPARSAAGPDAMIIELRSTGGQTVVPPSRHPSGESIVWHSSDMPAEVDYQSLLERVSLIAAFCLLTRYWPAHGSRDKAAMAMAGWLLRGGFSEDRAERFVRRLAQLAGDEEVESRARTVRDTAVKLGSGEPVTGKPTLAEIFPEKVVRRATEWLRLTSAPAPAVMEWDSPLPLLETDRPAFPTKLLPTELREWVQAEAVATQTPEDLAAMLSISVCATAIAKKVRIRVTDSWEEPVNLFTATILAPGNRKSAVFAHATAALVEFERSKSATMAREIAEAESEKRMLAEELRDVESSAAKADAGRRQTLETEARALAGDLAEMEVPAPLRLVVDDCSAEKLATILHEQGGRIAVLSAEGDVFDLMAGRYSAKGAPNFGVYLKGHAGDTIRVDRVGRPSEFIEAPAITVGLAVQPEILRSLGSVQLFRGRGLIARFLFAIPESPLGSRAIDPPAVAPEVSEAYRERILALLEMEPGRGTDGQPITHLLTMSAKARHHFLDYCRWIEPMLEETAELGPVGDWGSKLPGALARIAAIFHMVENAASPRPWEIPISSETITAVLPIGDYLIAHAKTAFAVMGADPEVSDAQYVLRWIEKLGLLEFSKRDLFERTKGRFDKVSKLDPALALLEGHGYLRIKPEAERTGPGRKPSTVYLVNPQVFGAVPHDAGSGEALCE